MYRLLRRSLRGFVAYVTHSRPSLLTSSRPVESLADSFMTFFDPNLTLRLFNTPLFDLWYFKISLSGYFGTALYGCQSLRIHPQTFSMRPHFSAAVNKIWSGMRYYKQSVVYVKIKER